VSEALSAVRWLRKEGFSDRGNALSSASAILKARGRLEEAMALLQKQEALCTELGNKRGLGYCYWNLGRLARELNDSPKERENLEAAAKIFTELDASRERSAVTEELKKFAGASGAD